VLHKDVSLRLRDDKLARLQATEPERIVSANIGCITHLQSGTDVPVEHWVELLDRALQ
jgi:glycolate oxidase iron-sulfur subunit